MGVDFSGLFLLGLPFSRQEMDNPVWIMTDKQERCAYY